MPKCVYCKKRATGQDAIGLNACEKHLSEADRYVERLTGRKPLDDSFLYCPYHEDIWQSGCPRCETCSHFHFGVSVAMVRLLGW